MGVAEHHLLLPMKSMVQGKEEMSKPSDSNLLNKTLEAQTGRRCHHATTRRGVIARSDGQKARTRSKRPRRILVKRRARLEDSSSATNEIRKRVRTLKKLIPCSESMGTLDGLFGETADYILSLQTRVKVMQIMVNVLTGSEESSNSFVN